ncbi:hypothetical protein D3C81_1455300 [compost metagenome]
MLGNALLLTELFQFSDFQAQQPSQRLIRRVLAVDGGSLQLAGTGLEGFDDLQRTLGVEQILLL